jgi:hypothetical protein
VLSSSSVVGGTPVTAVLTLTTTAPAGGAVVSLASSSAAVVVPASVTIPEGTNTLSFSVATTSAAASTTITATYAGANQTATLVTTVVTVAALETVFLSNSVSVAGTQLQGTVTLTAPAPAGGLAVSLASSTPVASVPGSVVVRPGQTTATFAVEIGASPTALTATITASASGVTRTTSLTIGQLALSVMLNSVPGGIPDTGVVSVPAPAPDGGALIALTSNSPNATVPATVTIPAGGTSQTFTIATVDAPPTQTAMITATYGGSGQTATFRIVAYPNLVAVSCNPSTAAAGTTIQCSGTLGTPGSASGWRLALASSDPAVTAPATVTLPPGSTTFQFPLATGTVSSVTAVTVKITDADSGFTLWTVGISVSP